MPNALPSAEWSYVIRGDSVPERGRHVKIKATPDECKAMTERVGVQSIQSVEAHLELNLQNGGHVLYIKGQFTAQLTQNCIVSGESLPTTVQEDFEAWFADHDKAIPFSRVKHDVQLRVDGDEIQMLEEHEDPEPMIDGQVDLGELVIQYLCLAVDPYPRHPDFQDDAEDISEDDKTQLQASAGNLRPNPFAALKNWRPKD